MSNFVDTITVEDQVVGYQCNNLVEGSGNTVENEELSFWFDVKFPEGGDGESEAIELVRSQLLESVADEFGVSDGFRCENPPLDGSVWAVRFTSNTNQFVKEDFFDTCRELEAEEGYNCFVYRGAVTATHISTPDLSAVSTYMEQTLGNGSLTAGSQVQVGFLGKPEIDETADPRDQVANPPASIKEAPKSTEPDDDKFTVLGAILVTLFVLAFVGIIFIVYRRRQKYLREQEDVELALSKSDLNYDTRGTGISEEDDEEQPRNHLAAATTSDDLSSLGGAKSNTEEFPNNITFDLGNSFKDQLMGVHGSQRQRTAGAGGLPALGSGDGASDASDADSWAQTEGTIGSLELQLEPITAEV